MNEIENFDLEKIGPQIENHEIFPEKCNVTLAKKINSCYGYRTATGSNKMHGGVDLDTTGLNDENDEGHELIDLSIEYGDWLINI